MQLLPKLKAKIRLFPQINCSRDQVLITSYTIFSKSTPSHSSTRFVVTMAERNLPIRKICCNRNYIATHTHHHRNTKVHTWKKFTSWCSIYMHIFRVTNKKLQYASSGYNYFVNYGRKVWVSFKFEIYGSRRRDCTNN